MLVGGKYLYERMQGDDFWTRIDTVTSPSAFAEDDAA